MAGFAPGVAGAAGAPGAATGAVPTLAKSPSFISRYISAPASFLSCEPSFAFSYFYIAAFSRPYFSGCLFRSATTSGFLLISSAVRVPALTFSPKDLNAPI